MGGGHQKDEALMEEGNPKVISISGIITYMYCLSFAGYCAAKVLFQVRGFRQNISSEVFNKGNVGSATLLRYKAPNSYRWFK